MFMLLSEIVQFLLIAAKLYCEAEDRAGGTPSSISIIVAKSPFLLP